MNTEGDTPSITVLARHSGAIVSLSCTEHPEWNVQSESFSGALFQFAKKAQAAVQDPFGSEDFSEPWDSLISTADLPPLLTMRFTWSVTGWTYVVTIDEVPGSKLSGPESLTQALYYIANRLYLNEKGRLQII